MNTPAITVSHFRKYYQTHQKEPGTLGAIKSLLARKYTEVKAVDDISFSIDKGELVGFIGPNGAGKTTTLKTLSGLLHPTIGTISVLGFTPYERNVAFLKQLSLVMGQKNQLWWDLPATDSFLLNKGVYEIPEDQYKKTLNTLVELLEFDKLLQIPVRKLSLGERMKAELIAALLHSPNVLFLDEPTIGLDVVMQKNIRDFIKEYNRAFKSTIILTSHYMEDVKELCKRVIIINKGKLLYDEKLDKIIQTYADFKLITIILDQDIGIEKVDKLGHVKEYDFPKVVFTIKRADANKFAAKILQKFPIADITIADPPIEAIIRGIFAVNSPADKI